MDKIKRMFAPPVFENNADKTRKARVLHTILLTMLGVIAMAAVAIPLTFARKVESATILGLAFLILIGVEGLLYTGRVRAASILAVALLLALAFGLSLFGAGVNGVHVAFSIAGVVVAGLLLGKRSVSSAFVVSLLSYSVLAWLETSHRMPPRLFPTPPIAALILFTFNLLIITVALWLTRDGIETALSHLRENEIELNQSYAALQSTLGSLEDQVAARTHDLAQSKEVAEIARREAEAEKEKALAINRLNEQLRGEQDIPTLAHRVIEYLCTYLGGQVGTFYVLQNTVIRQAGSYAYTAPPGRPTEFELGEGLVGQAALDKRPIQVSHVPDNYLTITSGLGQAQPHIIWIVPLLYLGRVVGVIEMGTLSQFTPAQAEFLQAALESIAIAFNTAQARARINELLAETQQQANELQMQEEELRAINEEQEVQATTLQTSQAQLRAQQSQLETTNSELEEKAAALQEKQDTLDKQNRELRAAREELEAKAQELTLANKYKSEFLANMSHELRTPLNSLLILAHMLTANEGGNLTADQVESAQIIYNSGADLLNLINEILDLSKVEAGKMTFHIAPMQLKQLANAMHAQFAHIAAQKKLDFSVTFAEDIPPSIETDQQRVEQIVKNLLSNAFKFTTSGSVRLGIGRPAADEKLRGELRVENAVAIRVTDSGIGMTPDQQQLVFEAFQQADGSTSRKYGGTGLGLAISRELATWLGGGIGLRSELGQGSTFTLYLPITTQAPVTQPQPQANESVAPAAPLQAPVAPTAPAGDKRKTQHEGDKVLLVIEDDPTFAQIVARHAREKGFRELIATDGETGLRMVETCKPNAIILDLKLPGLNGWQVLETLKQNPQTRHIPVHIISSDTATLDAYKMGAIGFLTKPASPEDLDNVFPKIEQFISGQLKTLLMVEDDDNARRSIKKLLEGSDVHIYEAASGQAALTALREQHFDCMILDLTLPDMSGFKLLDTINADESIAKCPIIIYTGQTLTEDENAELMKYANSIILKGAKSPERLLDETALFLHRVAKDISEDKPLVVPSDKETDLEGKHILVVDDDMRNAYVLSKVLRDKGIKVHIASSGAKALDMLTTDADIDLVLMDIMMPEMDGYETTRRIRAQAEFRKLPILALTAKAMKGDADKCIAAGANDYLSKPVDVDHLLSMLRVWLRR